MTDLEIAQAAKPEKIKNIGCRKKRVKIVRNAQRLLVIFDARKKRKKNRGKFYLLEKALC